jgi:hypothetical protein
MASSDLSSRGGFTISPPRAESTAWGTMTAVNGRSPGLPSCNRKLRGKRCNKTGHPHTSGHPSATDTTSNTSHRNTVLHSSRTACSGTWFSRSSWEDCNATSVDKKVPLVTTGPCRRMKAKPAAVRRQACSLVCCLVQALFFFFGFLVSRLGASLFPMATGCHESRFEGESKVGCMTVSGPRPLPGMCENVEDF